MASKSSSSRVTATNTSGVRRNLFQHHLGRRPTSASTTTSATTLQETIHDDSNDIVAKDSNGNFHIRVPVLPPLDDDDQAQEEDMGSERDKLEAKMLELYKDRSLQPGEPAELMSAVQANLKRKVASLDDDNWMFEAEQPTQDG